MFASSMFLATNEGYFYPPPQSFEEKIFLFKQTSLWEHSLPIFGEDVKIDENFFQYFPELLLIEKGTDESLRLFEEMHTELCKEKSFLAREKAISDFNERMFKIKTTIMLNSESGLDDLEDNLMQE